MSLQWKLNKIDGFEKLCFIHRDDGPEGPGDYLNPVTNSLIWTLGLHLGYNKITEENVDDVFRRYCIYCQCFGPDSSLGVEQYREFSVRTYRVGHEDDPGREHRLMKHRCWRPLTHSEFLAHIGLWTNGRIMTEAAFRKHMWEDVILVSARNEERRIMAASCHRWHMVSYLVSHGEEGYSDE
jgi:hypothetical protein